MENELQTTFNEDTLDILVEDGEVENAESVENVDDTKGVADNGNEN